MDRESSLSTCLLSLCFYFQANEGSLNTGHKEVDESFGEMGAGVQIFGIIWSEIGFTIPTFTFN